MKLPLRRKLEEVSAMYEIADEVIIQFINEDWINPIDAELRILDEEDISRILLIQDLREKFGVNDEAVPLILHLIDQLNFILYNTKEKTSEVHFAKHN